MARKIDRVLAVAALVMAAALAPKAAHAAPVHPMRPAELPAPALAVSFWGAAYPHGYSYRAGHPCIRAVRVHTRHGWRWRRTWICD